MPLNTVALRPRMTALALLRWSAWLAGHMQAPCSRSKRKSLGWKNFALLACGVPVGAGLSVARVALAHLAVRDIAVDVVGGQRLQTTLAVIAGVGQPGGIIGGTVFADGRQVFAHAIDHRLEQIVLLRRGPCRQRMQRVDDGSNDHSGFAVGYAPDPGEPRLSVGQRDQTNGSLADDGVAPQSLTRQRVSTPAGRSAMRRP